MDILEALRKECEKTGQEYEEILENYILMLHEFIERETGIVIKSISVTLERDKERLN